MTQEIGGFAALDLHPNVLAAVIATGYEEPSAIQIQAIPVILAGHDMIGQAQTGTGKTAAFALPILSRIDPAKRQPQALILAPTRELALQAIRNGHGLIAEIERLGVEPGPVYAELIEQRRVLAPLDHADPAHLHLTGTGLTHLGSASARDAMHAKLAGAESLTDSMKMFRMGLEGGRPAAGDVGAQPEWFYKGNGHAAVAPGAALTAPGFAEDGGEEPELAGIYVIAPDGRPCRLGWALANEFSDHVTERVNYLWLAHSKLREASFGPEILIGDLPADVQGTSRIRREGAVIWEKPFLSGEANMSHTMANLEHHHFKYGIFCQPGDLHVTTRKGTGTPLVLIHGFAADSTGWMALERALPRDLPLIRIPEHAGGGAGGSSEPFAPLFSWGARDDRLTCRRRFEDRGDHRPAGGHPGAHRP